MATVEAATGLATAVGNGDAVITAAVDGVTGQAALAVLQQVAAVSVTPGTASLAAIGATQQFTAVATDANNNDVANVVFVWLSSNHNVATIDAAGLATAVGAGTATVSAVGRGIPGTATLGVQQVAAQLAFSVQPTTAAAGEAISPAVQVEIRDANGALVATARDPVTIAIGTNPGGGALSGTKTVNAVGGIATFSGLSIDKAATGYTLVAAAGGLAGATSAPFGVVPAGSARLVFTTQPSDAVAGEAIAPAVGVAVQDGSGNTLPDAAATVHIAIATNPGAGTLSGTVSVETSAGVAVFVDLSIERAGDGYTLVATADGLVSASSGAFSVSPAAAARLAFVVQPSDVVAGEAVNPAVGVAIQDAFGNTVTDATDAITLALGVNPGGGTLSGQTTSNAVAGVASFGTLSLDKAATGYALAASSGALANAASAPFSVSPAAAVALAFRVQPSDAVAGEAISPAVQVAVHDAFGNTVTSASDAVVLALGVNPGGGALAGTKIVNAVSGVATFSGLWIDKAATGYSLAASSGSLAGATSTAFNIVAGPVAQLAFTRQPPALVELDLVIAPAVEITILDAFGNVVPRGTQVFIGIGTNPGGAVLSGTLSVSTSTGVAVFKDLQVDRTGLGYTLVADMKTDIAGESGVFDVFVWISTSAGGSHTCGIIAPTEAAYCWGGNDRGQLGDGTSTNRTTPVPVLGRLRFASVSAGGKHTCGVTTLGDAHCWGLNDAGQLGDGTRTGSSTPVLVSGGLSFSVVSAAGRDGRHTCGVTTREQVYCWGDNSVGQLGDGTTTTSLTPVRVILTDFFMRELGPLFAVAVSAGERHSCAVDGIGNAYCWGANEFGQLGNGSTEASTGAQAVLRPTDAVTGELRLFMTASAGGSHSCAVTTRPTGVDTEEAYCWGAGKSGQLGDGSTVASSTSPVLVNDSKIAGFFTAVSAGGTHTCGVRNAHETYCWGLNSSGQLGDGSVLNRSLPVLVVDSGTKDGDPLLLAAVTAGGTHTCGVGKTPAAYCWGDNGVGQLGDGTAKTDRTRPVRVAKP